MNNRYPKAHVFASSKAFRSLLITTGVASILAACARDNAGSEAGNISDVISAPQVISLLDMCGAYEVQPGSLTGVYKGEWARGSTTLNHELAILDERSDGSASVLYAYGSQPAWEIEPGCEAVTAQISDGRKLGIQFHEGAKAEYEFADGVASGAYSSEFGVTRGQFQKIP